jgi:hypothetical protein
VDLLEQVRRSPEELAQLRAEKAQQLQQAAMTVQATAATAEPDPKIEAALPVLTRLAQKSFGKTKTWQVYAHRVQNPPGQPSFWLAMLEHKSSKSLVWLRYDPQRQLYELEMVLKGKPAALPPYNEDTRVSTTFPDDLAQVETGLAKFLQVYGSYF